MKTLIIIGLIGMFFGNNIYLNTENRTQTKSIDWTELRKNKKDIELKTFTTGIAEINYKTFTQNGENGPFDQRTEVVINAFGFSHPDKGDILIDAGLSKDFYNNPPYGNLCFVVKLFQKKNKVKYRQEQGANIENHLELNMLNPKYVFITHLHPDHTSGIPYLEDDITLYYGINEDDFSYRLITNNHTKNKDVSLIDFTNGVPMEPFENVIDVFGDSSLFAISTKGHTKDHISYLINGDKPYLVVGDAELTTEAIRNGMYVNSDYGKQGEKDARESAEMIRLFCSNHPEVTVLYSHDL